MEKFTLAAEVRNKEDRLLDLRNSKMIPGVVYGKTQESTQLKVNYSEFLKLYRKTGNNHIISLSLGSKKLEVLVHETQKEPVTGDFTHIDFYAITAGQKIEVEIPVKFIGDSEAKKRDAAIIEEHMDIIEIKCAPADLIDFIEVDISALENIGDNIKVGDIKLDKSKYEILSDLESVIVSANEQAAEEDLSAPVVLELPKDEKEEKAEKSE
jgi:large subunit ribosomal protein L25